MSIQKRIWESRVRGLPKDQDEGENPVDEKKMSSAAKRDAKKYRDSPAGKAAIKKSLKKRSKPGYKVDPARAKKMAKSRAKSGVSASVQIPKTKNQMMKNIYDSINGMLEGDLATKYEDIMAATGLSIVEEELDEAKNEAKDTTFVVTPDYEFDMDKIEQFTKKIRTLKIKVDAKTMAGGFSEVEEYIGDEISNMTGWMHNGFDTKPDIRKVT